MNNPVVSTLVKSVKFGTLSAISYAVATVAVAAIGKAVSVVAR